MAMAGRTALKVIVTGAGMVQLAWWRPHPGRAGSPACCSSAGPAGPSTRGPGGRPAGRGTATSPPPGPRCVRRPRSARCRPARPASTACSMTITAAGRTRRSSPRPTPLSACWRRARKHPRWPGSRPARSARWPAIREALDPVTIIVDGANVIGARADGWWRDRAGAAARLYGDLAGLASRGVTELPGGPAGTLDRWFPQYVLVLEGKARAAAPDLPDT